MTGTKIRIIPEFRGLTEKNFCPKCKINYSSHRNKQANCPICKEGRIDGYNLLSPGDKIQCIICESIKYLPKEQAGETLIICHNKCNQKVSK
jgi:hypothetical protein